MVLVIKIWPSGGGGIEVLAGITPKKNGEEKNFEQRRLPGVEYTGLIVESGPPG
jgi:hypothetical protein